MQRKNRGQEKRFILVGEGETRPHGVLPFYLKELIIHQDSFRQHFGVLQEACKYRW